MRRKAKIVICPHCGAEVRKWFAGRSPALPFGGTIGRAKLNW